MVRTVGEERGCNSYNGQREPGEQSDYTGHYLPRGQQWFSKDTEKLIWQTSKTRDLSNCFRVYSRSPKSGIWSTTVFYTSISNKYSIQDLVYLFLKFFNSLLALFDAFTQHGTLRLNIQ